MCIANAIDISLPKPPNHDKLVEPLNLERGILPVVVVSWTVLVSGIDVVYVTIFL